MLQKHDINTVNPSVKEGRPGVDRLGLPLCPLGQTQCPSSLGHTNNGCQRPNVFFGPLDMGIINSIKKLTWSLDPFTWQENEKIS